MSIQEMSINGDEPPPAYIVKDSKFGAIESSQELGQIPIIDISLFSSPSSTDSKQTEFELDRLKSALSSTGCFQAIGHGISGSLLDKVREAAKQFFELPVEQKQKYSTKIHGGREGYGNDNVVSDKQVLDWNYRLILHVLPEDQRNLDLWPENPNNFRYTYLWDLLGYPREVLHEYATEIQFTMGVLYKAMERTLNLEENSFAYQLFGDQALMTARINFYPKCSKPDQVLGAKAHRDGSGMSILLQDKEVEGLQVLVDNGKWVSVPVVPEALVVNLGGQMQIISNGIFKSPIHRAVANSERMRLSVAMFNTPHREIEISPVEKLVHETGRRLYKNVKDYGRMNHECFQRGEDALDIVSM